MTTVSWFGLLIVFTFILNTLTNTPPVALPQLQVKCESSTRKTRHWAHESTRSVHALKTAKWTRNGKGGLTKYVSTSLLTTGDEGKERVLYWHLKWTACDESNYLSVYSGIVDSATNSQDSSTGSSWNDVQ
jgi:hypothetical protein